MNTANILCLCCGALVASIVSFVVCYIREWVMGRNHQTELRDSYRRGYKAGRSDGMRAGFKPLAPTN